MPNGTSDAGGEPTYQPLYERTSESLLYCAVKHTFQMFARFYNMLQFWCYFVGVKQQEIKREGETA